MFVNGVRLRLVVVVSGVLDMAKLIDPQSQCIRKTRTSQMPGRPTVLGHFDLQCHMVATLVCWMVGIAQDLSNDI